LIEKRYGAPIQYEMKRCPDTKSVIQFQEQVAAYEIKMKCGSMIIRCIVRPTSYIPYWACLCPIWHEKATLLAG
jgi:hypothetical protein